MNTEGDHLLRSDDGAGQPTLSEDQIALLQPAGREQVLADGEVLYQPGEPFDAFFVVLDGEIWIEDGEGDFLARNQVPHSLLDVEADGFAECLLRDFGVGPDDLPIVMLGQRVLRNPSSRELAAGLGLTAPLKPATLLDVVIVGAGPAGLGAAVYGASEGLSTALLDAVSVGGQAGMSSRIENYLGFPAGIAGAELAARAAVQAAKFGVTILTPVEVVGLAPGEGLHRIQLSDGDELRARTVIVATGARYRGLPLPRLSELEGAGVYYAATPVEATACRGGRVAVVGGGNSAGQAALFLAEHTRQVIVLVRGPDLSATMSQHLITRIAADERIVVLPRTEVRALHGQERLEGITVESTGTGHLVSEDICALFIFTGAEPQTGWLGGSLALDRADFVLTGTDLARDGHGGLVPLQTSRPGVFAVGDVRSGSTKRVATAVGEGAMAIRLVHEYLKATEPTRVG